jgi:hypothetical protein
VNNEEKSKIERNSPAKAPIASGTCVNNMENAKKTQHEPQQDAITPP